MTARQLTGPFRALPEDSKAIPQFMAAIAKVDTILADVDSAWPALSPKLRDGLILDVIAFYEDWHAAAWASTLPTLSRRRAPVTVTVAWRHLMGPIAMVDVYPELRRGATHGEEVLLSVHPRIGGYLRDVVRAVMRRVSVR